MYHVVRTNHKSDDHRTQMLHANLVINFTLLLLLLLVILVSEFVDNPVWELGQARRHTTCNGRVDLGPHEWPASRIIFISYLYVFFCFFQVLTLDRCVLFVLSILFGLAIGISGCLLQKKLNKGAKNKFSREEKASNKYLRLALLLSVSVIFLPMQLLLLGNIEQTRAIVYLRLTLLWLFELPSMIALLTYSTLQAVKLGGRGASPTDPSKTTQSSED